MSEKKYTGYGYHGGGRKPSSPDGQPRRTSMTITGTRSEIEAIRIMAKSAGKSVSRYTIDRVLPKEVIDGLLPADLLALVAKNAREIASGVVERWNSKQAEKKLGVLVNGCKDWAEPMLEQADQIKEAR